MEPQKYQKLREEISKVVTDIMVFKFGCYYQIDKHAPRVYKKPYLGNAAYCGECRENTVAGQAFTSYRCGYCKQKRGHPNTDIPAYCPQCAAEHEKCFYCKRKVRILGRDITLEDVLKALAAIRSAEWSVHADGRFSRTNMVWALGVPLHAQEPDLQEFLYNLIVKQ